MAAALSPVGGPEHKDHIIFGSMLWPHLFMETQISNNSFSGVRRACTMTCGVYNADSGLGSLHPKPSTLVIGFFDDDRNNCEVLFVLQCPVFMLGI